MSGAAVTTGQFGAFTPIAAEASGGGYKVVWKNGAANEYLVWDTDAGGNWLSQTAVMAGTTYAMQSLETTYGQDLNGDGTVGLKVSTIEAIGTTDLKQVADTYFLYDHGTTTGPQLKDVRRGRHGGPVRHVDAARGREDGERLSGRLEARRRRRVHRVDHRRQRQLAVAKAPRCPDRAPRSNRSNLASTRTSTASAASRPARHRVRRIDHPGHHCERLYAVARPAARWAPRSGRPVRSSPWASSARRRRSPPSRSAAAIRSPGRTAAPMSTSCGTLDGSGNWLSQGSRAVRSEPRVEIVRDHFPAGPQFERGDRSHHVVR